MMGAGEIIIEAKSKKEARELFLEGQWDKDDIDDTSDNYEVTEVNEI